MESDASLWSQELGGRLRMLQASFAEDPPVTREKYLVEEIERSLKGIAESRRNEYLDALARCFPGPERIGIAPSNPIPAVAEPVKKTVEELAEGSQPCARILLRARDALCVQFCEIHRRFRARLDVPTFDTVDALRWTGPCSDFEDCCRRLQSPDLFVRTISRLGNVPSSTSK